MKNHWLSGTGVALVTPFKNGTVDHETLKRVIDYVIEGGVDFIVSLGTTGESVTLSTQECLEVFDTTIEHTAERVPLVAGYFGGNNTANVVRRLKDFRPDGFQAIMSSSPAYNRPPQEGIYQHYLRLGENSPLPIIIYNVPSRTACNVLPETVLRLAEASSQFCAVKEATGDLVQGTEILRHRPPGFQVLSGDDPTAVPFIGAGADGVISVVANMLPSPFTTMINAALANNFDAAQRLHNLFAAINPSLYLDGNPAGVKVGLAHFGMGNHEVRLPLVPASAETAATVIAETKAFIAAYENLKVIL